MNVWKSITLVLAASAVLAGCGARPNRNAGTKSTTIESPAPDIAPVKASVKETMVCRDVNATASEAAALQVHQANDDYQQSKAAAQQARIALNQVNEDLRAAHWHRDQEESAMEQARTRELDAKLRLDQNTQLARMGAVADILVSDSDEAVHSAENLLSSIQLAVDSSSTEINTLESQRRQAMAALLDAEQRVSESESAVAAANAAGRTNPSQQVCTQ